jgi:Fe2+ or Zn2+ uptake regulation protein
MYDIDRTDLLILMGFEDGTVILNNPTLGMTIAEVIDYLDKENQHKSRKTVYLHLQKLTKTAYVKKGITSKLADTYYITDKGLKVLKGEL